MKISFKRRNTNHGMDYFSPVVDHAHGDEGREWRVFDRAELSIP